MSVPTHDPLSHPMIANVAALVQSGRATAEDLAKPYTEQWTRVPPALLPFVQSPSLSTLIEGLTSHPRLCRHWLVRHDMLYLLRLRDDEGEWQRLGWGPQQDEDGYYHWPPAEVAAVNQWREQLVKAHVSGLFPRQGLQWSQEPKKRGRKGGVRNPDPAGDWPEWLDAASLEEAFLELRSAFKTRLKERRQAIPRLKADAKAWYRNLAQEVLAQSSIE
jgi:hypothetical protein